MELVSFFPLTISCHLGSWEINASLSVPVLNLQDNLTTIKKYFPTESYMPEIRYLTLKVLTFQIVPFVMIGKRALLNVGLL